jgi:hypothetical protein
MAKKHIPLPTDKDELRLYYGVLNAKGKEKKMKEREKKKREKSSRPKRRDQIPRKKKNAL